MTLVSTQFVNVIQNVGFPIAAFGLMWHLVHTTLKENTRAIRDLIIAVKSKAI